MKKLFNLRKWLTVAETAQHLSIIFGEEVSDADVLRLALDEHLRLSVNFVNHTKARRGKVISIDEVELRKMPNWLPVPDELKDLPVFTPEELNLDGDRYLRLSSKVTSIEGVWDLPMIGGESLDIEHLYQSLTDGPEVTLSCLDGAFVEGENGDIWQLQESFDENEYQKGSKAQLKKIKEKIANKEIDKEAANKKLEQHKKDRNEFLEESKERTDLDNYYSADICTEDCVFVVKTSALSEFVDNLNKADSKQTNEISESERNSLLKIILGMAVTEYGYDPISHRNNATGKNRGSISTDLERLGIELNAETIRKYLKEAAEKFGHSLR